MGEMGDVSEVLAAVPQGERRAADELLPLVYTELRRLAVLRLANEKPGQTLEATALVHEAYLRLVGKGTPADRKWSGRGHFFAAAAEAMRRILIENARRKQRLRHGGGRRRVALDGQDVVERPPEGLLAIDEALTKLAAEDPEAAEVVKLHFYAGLSMDDVAGALGISRAGAYRQWTYSRAWLRDALTDEA